MFDTPANTLFKNLSCMTAVTDNIKIDFSAVISAIWLYAVDLGT